MIQLTAHEITVLLVDDQPMIGEAVRRMLAPEPDIHFHYCADPAEAIKTAERIAPTVILQDLVMPEIDGLTLVRFFRAHPRFTDTPLIVLSTKEEPAVKAEAFAIGANDYLVKLPDKVELIARIRYHSRGYISLLQRDEAYKALLISQKALADELAEAAAYVGSLLPPPLTEGPIRSEWRFLPSAQLGGDAFGCHWIDEDHFCMFLLDVCGHGVGAALLSISALNVLRSQSLPGVDFRCPGDLLTALNDVFLMEKQNNMYFTIWYGVYRPSTREIRFAAAGHPPALRITAGGSGEMESLRADGMLLGGLDGTVYEEHRAQVPPVSTLFLISDGVYEITCSDGSMWNYGAFAEFMQATMREGKPEIESLLEKVASLQEGRPFEDDFSILKIRID